MWGHRSNDVFRWRHLNLTKLFYVLHYHEFMGDFSLQQLAGFYQHLKELIFSFVRYLVAGGAGFLIDYGIFATCHEVFGVHHLLSATIGFICGLVFVYVVSNKWVFANRKMQHQQVVEFIVFTVIGLIGLLLTVLFMWLLTDVCSIHALISKLLTTALVLVWNFGTRKFILY